MVGLYKKKPSHRACLSFSGTAAIAPIIAAVKDGKSVTYEGREVRLLVPVTEQLQVGPGTLSRVSMWLKLPDATVKECSTSWDCLLLAARWDLHLHL